MPEFRHITVEPISGACGCEIGGVDLRQPLRPEVLGEIMLAFQHFLVIVFRDQDLTPEQHKAFSRHFGELTELPQAPTYNGDNLMQEVRREAWSRSMSCPVSSISTPTAPSCPSRPNAS
jgi:taurine dioxygenase